MPGDSFSDDVPPEVLAMHVDVSSKDQLHRMHDETLARWCSHLLSITPGQECRHSLGV